MDIGLAWHINKKYGGHLVWHNGQTGGYHSFIGFDPLKQRGVVVLANAGAAIDDLGFHLLDSRFPVASSPPAKERVAIQLPAATLDRFVGRYELAPGAFFNLRREDDRLLAQLTGQPYCEIFPESETNFFYKVVDAQLSFAKDANGDVTGLMLHQNGMDQTARKISGEPPRERQVAKVDPKLFDAYVGEYQLTPDAVFTIHRDGERLLARLTGQADYEIFPESETNFFYKIVDAQISIVEDDQGRVTGLVLHQNGQNPEAKKIK
jgi:D-alanyl-D-alanine-carboxypeptidase/D-alanyl-D-alanine-endopeptidase